jgi:molybdenum cofactor cytidylyltransferase
MTVRGVILAAGLGRRMGTIKQLLPMHGKPLLQHVIDAARASCLDHLLLVLGSAHEKILPKIDARGLDVIVNADFAAGQSTSVRSGLEHGPDAEGVMFLLGDQPLVGHTLIDILVERFLDEKLLAVVPVHRGLPGSPAIIGREIMRQATTLTGDTGARRLLREHSRHVLEVEVDDPSLLRDVDTMDDYRNLLAMRQPGADEIFRP